MQSEDAKLMIIDEVNEGICVGKIVKCKKILVNNMENAFTLFNKCML